MPLNPTKNRSINQAAINTLAYFDIFNYPLTLTELRQNMFFQHGSRGRLSLVELKSQLHTTELAEYISSQNGFYFLQGREKIIESRWRRYRQAQGKWRRARRAAKLLKSVPFLRLVAVCNTLAVSNTRPAGDIDFFIITKAGRIWLTRLLVTALVGFMGLRRHGGEIANKICLSFYLADDSLDLRSIAADPYDIYLMYWTKQLVPLYDDGQTLRRLHQANGWIDEHLPFKQAYGAGPRRRVPTGKLARGWKRFGEILLTGWLGERMEDLARGLQKRKMSHNIRSVAKEPNIKVIISDQMLKFHEFENDPKEVFRTQFEQRLKEVYGQDGLPGMIEKPERKAVEVNT